MSSSRTSSSPPASLSAADLVPGASSRARSLGVAALRIGVSLMWLQNVGWKVPPDFGEASGNGLYEWVGRAVEFPVLAPWASFAENVVLPNIAVFGWLVLLIEGGLGAFLLIGLATRLWAVVGIAQTIAITLSVLNAPHEWQWSYYLMFLAHVAIFATAAGRSYGVDRVLRPQCVASTNPLARILARIS